LSKSLIILAKHHKEWVNIVKSFGEKDFQEDIVQEMYLRFTKYAKPENVIINNKVNKSFIWIMLRNIYYDKIKFEKRIETVSIDNTFDLCYNDIDTDNINAFSKLYNKINETKLDLHYFDSGLLKLYFEKDMSMRDIAKETKIGLTTIFQSINKSKQRIREVIEEDYIDYLNKDYEWLKDEQKV
jgi:hypothetical protein